MVGEDRRPGGSGCRCYLYASRPLIWTNSTLGSGPPTDRGFHRPQMSRRAGAGHQDSGLVWCHFGGHCVQFRAVQGCSPWKPNRCDLRKRRGCTAVDGPCPDWQCGGQGFESPQLHPMTWPFPVSGGGQRRRRCHPARTRGEHADRNAWRLVLRTDHPAKVNWLRPTCERSVGSQRHPRPRSRWLDAVAASGPGGFVLRVRTTKGELERHGARI